MSLPLVSVIVPAYNSAPYLERALDSALGQTYSPLEVIVVDDGSTDDTPQVVARYGDRVRYVRQANRKLPGARNTGIRHARGELIAFLDADDWWTPDKLARQVPLLLDNPRVGVVHSGFEFYDDVNDRYLPSNYFHRIAGHELAGNCYVRLLDGNAINVCTAVVRRECFARVGLFNEGLVWGMEDYELWFRVARHYEFAYLPQVLAVYRRHGSNMSSQMLRMYLAELLICRRVLAADPELGRAAGRERVCQKLCYLTSAIGRHYLDAGDLRQAHHYLTQAVRCCPPSRPAWDASWAVGRLYYEKDLSVQANRYFARAVAQRAYWPYFWALWFITLLPFPFKEYWRAVVGRLKASRDAGVLLRLLGPRKPEDPETEAARLSKGAVPTPLGPDPLRSAPRRMSTPRPRRTALRSGPVQPDGSGEPSYAGARPRLIRH